jgi:hypothetical protein
VPDLEGPQMPALLLAVLLLSFALTLSELWIGLRQIRRVAAHRKASGMRSCAGVSSERGDFLVELANAEQSADGSTRRGAAATEGARL